MSNITQLRAQFGISPVGDPYGDISKIAGPSWMQAGFYSAMAARHTPPSMPYIKTPIVTIPFPPEVFLSCVPRMLQGRYIAYVLAATPTGSPCSTGPCTTPQQPINLGNPSSALGIASSIGGVAASIAIPIAAPGVALFSSFLTDTYTKTVGQQATEIVNLVCQISAQMTAVIGALDQAVGSGQLSQGGALQLYDQYANQAKASLSRISGSLIPWPGSFFQNAIDAMRDFSATFWTDIFPTPQVAAPAQPVITTPTPAPATEFAVSAGLHPATVIPSSIVISQPGSPIIRPTFVAITPKASHLALNMPTLLLVAGGIILLALAL